MTQPAQAPILTTEQIWSWLREIPDPEIPVISITDLGIIRDVTLDATNSEDPTAPAHCTITVTPTYSGCPATEVIAAEIRKTLGEHGLSNLELVTQLAPPWTTDWLTETGRQNLRAYGISPPSPTPKPLTQINFSRESDLSSRPDAPSAVVERPAFLQPPCPLCGSTRTEVLSQFSSTPCKSLHRCLACREPFDHFKPH